MVSIKHSVLMVVVVSLLLQHGRGAPSVFLVHPLLITADAQLAIQGHPRLFLANVGDGSVVDQQSQLAQAEDYVEGVEESRDWREDDASANETGTNSQEQESNDYTEKSEQGSEMEENKDDSDDGSYHETEEKTEGASDSDDGSYHGNDETEEKTEEKLKYASDSDDGSYHGNDKTEEKTEEKLKDPSDSDDGSYHEQDESAGKVEYQEKDESGNESDDGLYHENVESDEKTEAQETQGDASHSDDGLYHENDESGNKAEQEKHVSDDGSYHETDQGQSIQYFHDEQNDPKKVRENRQSKAEKEESKIEGVEIGINHKEQTNSELKRNISKANGETEINSNAAKSSVDEEEDGKDKKAAKPLRVPEEIVIGSIDKAQVEVSERQNVQVAATDSGGEDSSAAVKLNPPLKETEEVQLAPVVYHVSPKSHQDAEPPVTAA